MRLGINGWRLCGQRTGVGRYLLNVIRHWTSDAGSRFDRITLYTPRPIDRGDIPLPPNIHNEVLASGWPMLASRSSGPAAFAAKCCCPSLLSAEEMRFVSL